MVDNPSRSDPLNSRPPQAGVRTDQKTDDWTNSDVYGDEKSYLPVEHLIRQYMDYLTAKMPEIEEQKEARHYYHGAQWTPEQIELLRKRRQPVVTYNRIGRKINGIVGIAEQQRQDPKAYPKGPNGEEGAELATLVVRSVCDASEWNFLKPECLRQAGIEGIGGVELRLVGGDKGDPDLELAQVFGDDYFYDPRSYKADFSDARYEGVAKWLDIEAAIELFPDKEEELRGLIDTGTALTTYADREFKYILVHEQRVRLVEHWYKKAGTWYWCFYIGPTVLDQGVSPFRDNKGKSSKRFWMFSLHVDHDGDRYGFVRNLRGMQDEINQRRSKALHITNSRRLILDKGAVDDVEAARIEWARPDGVVEVIPNKRFEADPTKADLAGQFQFLEEAKNEMEAYANINPAALAGPGVKNLSGRAVNMLQKPGLAELGPAFIAYRAWCVQVYRAIWCAASQFWQAERWLRIGHDPKVAQFVQVNGTGTDQWGRPVVINAIGNLDVEIKLDEGPDTETAMLDTFDVISQFPPGSIPPQVIIELAPIPGSVKEKVLAAMSQPDPMAAAAKQLAIRGAAAKVQETQASTLQKRARALSDVASAAHKANEAHLSAAEFARDGLQDSDVSNNQSGSSPIAPQQSLTPYLPADVTPPPKNATLAARLTPEMPNPQMLPGILQMPRRSALAMPGNGAVRRIGRMHG